MSRSISFPSPSPIFANYTVLKTTTMPSYKDKFSAQEQADVEAYLLSLKGVK